MRLASTTYLADETTRITTNVYEQAYPILSVWGGTPSFTLSANHAGVGPHIARQFAQQLLREATRFHEATLREADRREQEATQAEAGEIAPGVSA